jgi:hypothetical protein
MHDRNGIELKVGDVVVIEAEVTDLHSGASADYCNVNLQPVKAGTCNGKTPMDGSICTCTKFVTLSRRLPVVTVLCVAGLFASGCSQFQARGVIGSAIDTQAANAPALIGQCDRGTMSQADAQALLATNATVMAGWSAAKTTNVFAYWFSDKAIWCNQDYADDLDKAAARFDSAASRCATQPADAAYFVRREETDFLKFKAAKDGKPQ